MSIETIGGNAKEQLRTIVERVEYVEKQISDLSQDRTDIYKEATGNGFNAKALREIVRRRKADAQKLAEHEATVELYMSALNMLVRS